MRIGYFLSCEEYGPEQLIEQAIAAEAAGFAGLWISDHLHPWNDEQGQSPMVWPMIGAIAQAVSLPIMTAVTCPIGRQSPLLVAQAAATCAILNPGFTLGVGTGEALNEHVTGAPWPSFDIRLEMLVEAVELIRELWTGKTVNHRGRHFTVDDARIYTLPDSPPEIWMSGFGEVATRSAATIADGYVGVAPDADLVGTFKHLSGGKPAAGGLKVAYAPTADEGVEHAHRLWSTSGLPGELGQVLPSPRHFEQAAQLVTKDATRASVTAGCAPAEHVAAVRKYAEAGYDQVYVANMGPHYLEMIEFYGEQVLPGLRAD
ncbi:MULTISPECIES: TIGR03557 family F420-dependent LLM class oxidoreductase [unclassified Nocardioides]|uniref:TIGR03557 family F420-dependent LLM class oxidoreductase n=1 Tax=unclassified Nocardioides TaxID=2615069 RepID=UPI0006F4FEA6|nr:MULTISPECIES: TIGR03557 family F420-dependent LLM class oxidoreductase [unclassified Nocardioides]KRA30852.1 LLM class F420-dependent oxidoreductase [Nocardioides sp. Root614]KRA87472.1 LLM class F420-dependent oxidoreductase [Nocardioides sp. Root682]